jgi:hypothetical protein
VQLLLLLSEDALGQLRLRHVWSIPYCAWGEFCATAAGLRRAVSASFLDLLRADQLTLNARLDPVLVEPWPGYNKNVQIEHTEGGFAPMKQAILA